MSQNVSLSLKMAIIVSLGGFVFGFDASVISGVVGFVTEEFQLTDWQQGFVVSSPTLGAAIASLGFGPLSDQIGRKKVLIGIAFLYVVSAFMSAFAISYTMLITARFIGGLAFASLVIAPMYIAEVAPARLRGKMVSINQLNIVIGLSAAYFANYLILKMSTSGSEFAQLLSLEDNVWRWMLGIEMVPAFIFFLLLFFIPESPRWLAVKGRTEDAKRVLNSLMSPAEAAQQMDEINNSTASDHEPFLTRLSHFFSGKMKLVILIGLVVGIIQQITGVNAVYFYAPSIFEQSGIGQDAAFAQAIWVGIINVVFTIVAMVLIDKLGRKPLLVGGLSGIMISMAICTYGFSTATYTLTADKVGQLSETVEVAKLQPMLDVTFDSDLVYKQALVDNLGQESARANESQLIMAAANMNPTVILLGILGFVASFAVSLGPVMWVLLSEIFPNQIRGIAISFIGVVNSGVSFTVQLVFPWELSNFGAAGTFMLYGIFAFIGLLLVIWLLPETKGKSLEQLEHMLVTGKSHSI